MKKLYAFLGSILVFALLLSALVAGLHPALGDAAVAAPPDGAAVVADPINSATATAGTPASVPAVVPVGLPPEAALIGVLATLAVAALKRFAPDIPGPWLPWISTAFGALIELGLSKAGITHGIGWMGGAAAGVAGVGLREHVDQLKKATGFPSLAASVALAPLLAIGLVTSAALLGSGCTSYRHQRFSDAGQPIEDTSLRAPFLTKTALSNLRTKTSEKRGTNTYSRSVGLDSAEARVDAEGIQAAESAIGRLLIEGLKASSGVGAFIPSAAPAAATRSQAPPPPEIVYVTNHVASPTGSLPPSPTGSLPAGKPDVAPAVKPASAVAAPSAK